MSTLSKLALLSAVTLFAGAVHAAEVKPADLGGAKPVAPAAAGKTDGAKTDVKAKTDAATKGKADATKPAATTTTSTTTAPAAKPVN